MLSTLFHIPSHVGPLPLFGWGLLLAIWVAVAWVSDPESIGTCRPLTPGKVAVGATVRNVE